MLRPDNKQTDHKVVFANAPSLLKRVDIVFGLAGRTRRRRRRCRTRTSVTAVLVLILGCAHWVRVAKLDLLQVSRQPVPGECTETGS